MVFVVEEEGLLLVWGVFLVFLFVCLFFNLGLCHPVLARVCKCALVYVKN